MSVPRKLPKKRRAGAQCTLRPAIRLRCAVRVAPPHTKLSDETAGARSRLESLGELLERLRADQLETQEQRLAIESAVSQLTDPVETRERIARLRMEIEDARGDRNSSVAAHTTALPVKRSSAGRLSSIAGERASWETRVAGAKGRIEELQARRLKKKPARNNLPQGPLRSRSSAMRCSIQLQMRKRSAEKRQIVSRRWRTDLPMLMPHCGVRKHRLRQAREGRVRAEASVEQTKSDCDAVSERIAERLDSKPQTILADAEIDPEEQLPPRDVVEDKLERLIRERDNMGPVNLRAEQELLELEEQIGTMQTEREDLLAAIARLRQGNFSAQSGRPRKLARRV